MQSVTVLDETWADSGGLATTSHTQTRKKWQLPGWVSAVVLYILARALVLLLMARVCHLRGEFLLSRLTEWDGRWFLALAQSGYEQITPGLYDAHYHHDIFTAYAFFPGYPWVIRLVTFCTPLNKVGAALLVSAVASIFAAAGIWRIGELCGGRRMGVLTVLLFAAAPMGVVMWMAYSESLFCALTIGALVGILEKHWIRAGICAFCAGLVRPTGIVVLAILAVAAIVYGIKELKLSRHKDFSQQRKPQQSIKTAICAALLAPLGLMGYLAWVSLRTHEITGWFSLQRKGWGTTTDYGRATLLYVNAVVIQGREIVDAGTALILIGAIILLVILLVQRWPWELKMYGILMCLSTVTSAGLMHCRPRLLLPIFVLALPLAHYLSQTKTRTQIWVCAGALIVAAWFGTYMIVIYPHSI